MKKWTAMLLALVLTLSLTGGAWAASGEADTTVTPQAQAWWDSFTVPEGMEDVTLYPDENLALREKNYETVCRFMQGLSPYLFMLYADDVVTGVAYDFSLTKNAMRNSNMAFQLMLDASNAESYPDWTWSNIEVYQSSDPNVFVVECDGSGTLYEDGEPVRTHTDHYLHRFTLSDGKITEYIEYNNPIQELLEMGVDVPGPGGMPSGGSGEPSGEASDEASGEPSDEPKGKASDEPSDEPSSEPSDEPSDEPKGKASGELSDEPKDKKHDKTSDEPSDEPAEPLTAEEQAWWDGFEVPEGMDGVALFPDDRLALREQNYETVCRYMVNLNPYLYLLLADEFSTGVAYDFGGTTNPFNPVMCTNLAMQKALDASNAETYSDWQWSDYRVYQSDDPNVFLVECDGGGNGHNDHYVHKFVLTDGKIRQYVEFNSPLNELIEGGYEVPNFH